MFMMDLEFSTVAKIQSNMENLDFFDSICNQHPPDVRIFISGFEWSSVLVLSTQRLQSSLT